MENYFFVWKGIYFTGGSIFIRSSDDGILEISLQIYKHTYSKSGIFLLKLVYLLWVSPSSDIKLMITFTDGHENYSIILLHGLRYDYFNMVDEQFVLVTMCIVFFLVGYSFCCNCFNVYLRLIIKEIGRESKREDSRRLPTFEKLALSPRKFSIANVKFRLSKYLNIQL